MNQMKPKVSVVIPAYNEEKLIERCLKSLCRQSMPREEYEIIIVDNNSNDKTAKIAKKYADKVVIEKKKGILFARQKGFGVAKAEIVLRTDADGMVPRDWVKIGYKYFEENPEVVAVSGFYFPDSKKDLMLKATSNLMIQYKELVYQIMGKIEWLTGSCSGFRKSVFDGIGGFDLKADTVVEDQQGIAHRMSKCGTVAFNKDWWVYYSPRRFKNRKMEIAKFANDYLLYQMMNNLYYYIFKRHPKKVMGKWEDIRE